MKAVGIITNRVYAQARTKAQCMAEMNRKYPSRTGPGKPGFTNNLYPEPITIVRENRQRSELQRLRGLKFIVNPKGKVH